MLTMEVQSLFVLKQIDKYKLKSCKNNRTDFENASDGGALRQSVSVETATVTVSESISSFFSTVNRYMVF